MFTRVAKEPAKENASPRAAKRQDRTRPTDHAQGPDWLARKVEGPRPNYRLQWSFCKIPVSAPVEEPTPPPLPLQRKLAIGSVNDPLEQEADRVAEQVMWMPAPEVAHTSASLQINRECAACEAEEEEKLQKKETGSKDPILRQEESRYYQKTDPNLPANQPAVIDFFFCKPPLYDEDMILRALDTAKLWVASAILKLDQFTMGGQTIEEEAAVRLALRDNFNINITETHPPVTLLPKPPLETIHDNFVTIEGALNQTLQFFCTSGCRLGELAWVLPNPEKLKLPPGIITICQPFFKCDPLKQASTIIHERAHEALKAQDHAYEVDSKYDSLPTIMALENAESYAVAARQIHHGGIHGPGLSCSGVSRVRPLELPKLTPGPLKAPSPPRHPRLPSP